MYDEYTSELVRMWWVHTLVSLWMSTTFSANWCWLEFCNWIKLEMLKMWWGMNKTLFLISLLINCCLIYLTSSYFKLRHECSKKMEEFNLKTAYLKIFPLPTFFFVWREITNLFVCKTTCTYMYLWNFDGFTPNNIIKRYVNVNEWMLFQF